MLNKLLFTLCLNILIAIPYTFSQQFYKQNYASKKWVRQQFRKLSDDEKIAQLMVIRAHSNLGADHVKQVSDLIQKYNVGALCFFQGGPARQAVLTNYYQSISKTPLMICIDGEWGLGMRLDSIASFPRQLMIGATHDPALVEEFGRAVGKQCKRLGIQMNYAPVVDVNNNPDNPVINDRSFGENKYKVAAFGVAYMKGMQSENVMACAKHFPGHGDVSVDSHLDLPIINKSRAQLDSLELYPFKQMIKAGVGSVMMAHLYIPAIDTTANLATSLSPKAVNGILRKEIRFKGIAVTDGLEMKGISKFFPDGEAAAQALIAGNDMLCLPSDIQGTIDKVKLAIKDHRLSWKQINKSVRKVLLAKYNLGLNQLHSIDTNHIVADINAETASIESKIATNAVTLLRNNSTSLFPLNKTQKIAYIAIGIDKDNSITSRLKNDLNADTYFFSTEKRKDSSKETIEPQAGRKIQDSIGNMEVAKQLIAEIIQKGFDAIVVGVHNYSRRPANNFGINQSSIYLMNQLQQQPNSISLFFGNPYAIKFACHAPNLIACYEDDEIIQNVSANILEGKLVAKGTLPVTVCEGLKFNSDLR